MLNQLKLYGMGLLAILATVLGFLLQNAKLKAKTRALQDSNKNAQIQHDVSKILANRNVREVLKGVDKEISNGDTSSLDG